MVFDGIFHVASDARGGLDGAIYHGLELVHAANVERHASRHASSQSNACLDWARITNAIHLVLMTEWKTWLPNEFLCG